MSGPSGRCSRHLCGRCSLSDCGPVDTVIAVPTGPASSRRVESCCPRRHRAWDRSTPLRGQHRMSLSRCYGAAGAFGRDDASRRGVGRHRLGREHVPAGKAAPSRAVDPRGATCASGPPLLLTQRSRCAVPSTPDCATWPLGCAPKSGLLQHGHAARPVRWFGGATRLVRVRLVLRFATFDGPRFAIGTHLPGTAIA
jgi:hypothetical protein